MKDKHYGTINQTELRDDTDRYIEEIRLLGYTVIEELVEPRELSIWRDRIDSIYAAQEEKFGKQELDNIQEVDVCRAPLLYDINFLNLATLSPVLSIVERMLGDWYILNLQNAIINRPHTRHHQSSWHRDLPYQNFVCSQPLAVNALIAIDEFDQSLGATCILPYSHRMETLPSDGYIERNQMTVSMPPGSVVMFDAMLLHRAGVNTGASVRRAINHLYTRPILKQQYDFPRALGEDPDLAPELTKLLGYTSQVPLNDVAWRRARSKKLGR